MQYSQWLQTHWPLVQGQHEVAELAGLELIVRNLELAWHLQAPLLLLLVPHESSPRIWPTHGQRPGLWQEVATLVSSKGLRAPQRHEVLQAPGGADAERPVQADDVLQARQLALGCLPVGAGRFVRFAFLLLVKAI